MNKLELVRVMAEKADVNNATAEKALNAFIETITTEMKKGNKVSISGLGSFEKVARAARMGVNPMTKEKIKIAAKNAPKFKAAKALKDAVNSK